MNTSETSHECDVCCRQVKRIFRNYGGRKHCSACYKRLFIRVLCPRCANFARLPRYDGEAVCLNCEKSKPCKRCGAVNFRIGKLTEYGPVCTSCSPHFREPQLCEICNEPSRRLSRYRKLGHNRRMCPRCARAHHSICSACRRFREIFNSVEGKALCKVCLEKGYSFCTVCGKGMPSGRGRECETCYWTRTFEARVKLGRAVFQKFEIESKFIQFSHWLILKTGPLKSAISIGRHRKLFEEIEKTWGEIPTYAQILEHFGARIARKNALPIRWLAETDQIKIDSSVAICISESKGISQLLAVTSGNRGGLEVLTAYYDHLRLKEAAGKTCLRSVRLALRPAASILSKTAVDGIIDQSILDNYLLEAPGQRAAITGFVAFYNKHKNTLLAPKVDQVRLRQKRRKDLEAKISELSGKQNVPDRQWIPIALAYFHGLPSTRTLSLDSIEIIGKDGGISVEVKGKRYWVPSAKSITERPNL